VPDKTEFYLRQLSQLLGGRITRLARSGKDRFGVEVVGFIVSMPDGKQKTLLIFADDEGNGPGSFKIQ
jgi:hypothetical protein